MRHFLLTTQKISFISQNIALDTGKPGGSEERAQLSKYLENDPIRKTLPYSILFPKRVLSRIEVEINPLVSFPLSAVEDFVWDFRSW